MVVFCAGADEMQRFIIAVGEQEVEWFEHVVMGPVRLRQPLRPAIVHYDTQMENLFIAGYGLYVQEFYGFFCACHTASDGCIMRLL